MRKYFVHDGQNEKGPYTIEDLSSEDITAETPVWYEGLESWTIAGNVNELKSLFIKKITPPPLPKTFTAPPHLSPAPTSPAPQKRQPLPESQEKKKLPENDIPDRNQILNSFEEAHEAHNEPPKKSFLIPILVGLIILGVVITIIILRK
jgi:hypothetical protein